MIVLPLDIFAYIARYTVYSDLKHIVLANKTINRNLLIRKQIFRLRLEKSVNCRTFMPLNVAKKKHEELKARIQPLSNPIILDNKPYLSYIAPLLHLIYYWVYWHIRFSDDHFYVKCMIGFRTRISDLDTVLSRAKALYPYQNVKKDQITV